MPLITPSPSPAPAKAAASPAKALVNRIVTDVRQQPADESLRLSQALLGEAVTVLDQSAEWACVRLERDGCTGWVHVRALHPCAPGEAEAYRKACNVLVSTELLPAFLHLAGGPVKAATGEAGKLPFGLSLPMVAQQGLWAAVRLPDGAQWWVSNILLPLSSRPAPDAPGLAFALELVKRCVGTPFLAGGRTPFGFDAAGFAQALWGFVGVDIPRHAPEQFDLGQPVESEPRPGDLVFFGEPQGDGQRSISHVAIALGGDDLIHANRYSWSVAIHSLNEASSHYHAWLCNHLVGVRRFA